MSSSKSNNGSCSAGCYHIMDGDAGEDAAGCCTLFLVVQGQGVVAMKEEYHNSLCWMNEDKA